WLMVITLLTAILGGGGAEALFGAGQMDPLAIAVAGVVAVVYLFVQGRVDQTSALGKIVNDLPNRLSELEKLVTELRGHDQRIRGATDRERPPATQSIVGNGNTQVGGNIEDDFSW
ncbi:MAG TPA: hypothetical protein VN764_12950, partial [Polyangiaceae bacterium]|nr:hypothetical protein [Polyangiaceae bacterium]